MMQTVNKDSYPHAHIYPYQNIWPKIGHNVFIAPGAVIVGDVTIEDNVNIWYGCVLRGDVNSIHVGANTNIQDGTIVHVATHGPPTIIGARVSIGHAALIHACHIHDEGFIGMKACVMDAAIIEPRAFVAAGALVAPNKHIPANELWAGTPAKKIRDISEKDAQLIDWTWPHYVELAQKSNQSLQTIS